MTAEAPPHDAASARPPSSADGRFFAGQHLGERYRIVGRLGRGGMGEVYRADDLELGQSVALKFLPERLAADDQAIHRLRSEVRLARTVSHANVCRVYDIGQADGHFFISMEYVDGEDLSDALRRMGRPSREKAEELARQVCLGLAAAHEVGVLHRDLKPANIMIDGRGRARITDFGLARLAEDLEGTNELAGTPAYMAPEQLTEGRVSVKSDIYSLGLVLHELFTGRRLFESDSIEELCAEHASGSSTSSFEGLDPAVERVLKRCLDGDPGARPRSVYAVLAALPGGDPLAAALAAGETPSPELVASTRSARSMGPRAVALLVLWVVGSIIAGTYASGRGVLFPQRATSELAVVAGEIAARELGQSELPPYDATGLIQNPNHKNEGVRPYAVWRRWSPNPIESSEFHNPEHIRLNAPSHVLPGSVAVLVDDTGTLIEALVIVSPLPHDPTAEADLDPLLERAGIEVEAVTAERVDPATLDPPLRVHCERVTVWRDAATGEPVARAGVYAGQIVAFQRVGHAPDLPPTRADRGVEILVSLLLTVAYVAMILVAMHNLRLGRGDRRGALRTAIVMLIAGVLMEICAFDFDQSLLGQILGLFGDATGGHALLHSVQVGIIYLAFEPIARRAWPRVLIGWVRLLDGRLRDPRVGGEILIGLSATCVPMWVAVWAFTRFGDGAEGGQLLGNWQLFSLVSPAVITTGMLHSVSASLFFTMFAVAFIGTGYLVTGRRWVGMVVTVVMFGLLRGVQGDQLAAVFVGAVEGGLVVTVFALGGLVSVFASQWFFIVLGRIPLTSDLSVWHAPYTVFVVFVILLVLAHGAWAALAGRER